MEQYMTRAPATIPDLGRGSPQPTQPGGRLMSSDKKYWFPAKRYGWGWGAPATWQGWMVLVLFLIVLTSGALWLLPEHVVAYLVFTGILCLILIAVCWLKGEPPRWRWGGD